MKKKILGLALAMAVSALGVNAMAEEQTASDHISVETDHVHDGVTVTSHKLLAVTVKSTCHSTGVAMYECSSPDVSEQVWYHEVTLPKLEHVWGDWKVTKEPNCKEDGASEQKCTLCGDVNTEIIPRPTEPSGAADKYHLWDEWIIEKPATCSETGLRVRWCKRSCGAKRVEVIPELLPVWKETSKVVTDCEHITYTYKCANCNGAVAGHSKTEVVKASSHAFVYDKKYEIENVPATCETNGYIVYKCKFADQYPELTHPTKKVVVEAKGHQWGEWVLRHGINENGNETGYWKRDCKVCKLTDEKISYTDPNAPVVVKNGIVAENGVYNYYKDGQIDTAYVGIVPFDGAEFLVSGGKVRTEANGLKQCGSKWYYVSNGKVRRDVNQVAGYDKQFFMVANGELDMSANGLYDYNGRRFAFAAGRLRTDIDGLWQNPVDGCFYYLANGQVANHTGVVGYDGEFFYVVDGKLASFYNGTVIYDGAKFNVVNGQLYDQVK